MENEPLVSKCHATFPLQMRSSHCLGLKYLVCNLSISDARINEDDSAKNRVYAFGKVIDRYESIAHLAKSMI